MARPKFKDPRHSSAARLAAAQGLYEIEITGATSDAILLDFIEKRWQGASLYNSENGQGIELAEADKNKFSEIINGVRKNSRKIDNILATALKNDRNIENLDVLMRAVLRAAVFELFFLASVPVRVIINEYVDLARAFYSENEPSLVNGVLDAVAKVVRQKELER
ncbi:MAG: transcription antitermination factor NusB [Pseudomonadota bacterium]|nr:transcription antitermination factor NusB [Pseudomonadota bacterium]